MPERFKVVCIPCKALYKCSAFPFNHFDVIGPKAPEVRECQYVVQRPSRSPVSLPMESLFATSCSQTVVTYIVSCTVSNLFQIIGPNFAVDKGMPLFQALILGKPLNLRYDVHLAPHTRNSVLSHRVKII